MIALLLAAAVAAAPLASDPAAPPLEPGPRSKAVEQSVRDVLKSEQYLFCHDPEYPLYVDEEGWCRYVGDPNPRCPTLPAACKGESAGYKETNGRGGSAARGGGKHQQEEDVPRLLNLPNLGGLGLILFYLLIAGAVCALAYAIVRSLVYADDDPAPARDRPEPAGPAQAAAQARGPIETDVERLLALARAAAERGEFERALDFLYAALLRRLDGDGLIRIRPWRTNGDYVRDLRDRPGLRADVRAIVLEIERVQFGAQQATGELFGALLGRVLPMVTRALAALALIATFLGATSCTFRKRGIDENTPSGNHAVLELLGKTGFKAHERTVPLTKMGDAAETLVLLPGAHVDAEVWKKLIEWVKQGNTLVVATGGHHLPIQLGVEVVPLGGDAKPDAKPDAKAGAKSDAKADAKPSAKPEVKWGALPKIIPDGRVTAEYVGELGDLTIQVPDARRLRVLPGSDAVPIIKRGDDVYATEIDLGEGTAVVLPDDYLLTNASLTVADNAAFLVALLDRFNVDIELSDETTGEAPPNPIASIGRGKLAPLTVQLALLLGLFFLYRGVAFGELRDPPSMGRRSFADHVRALGAQYGKARAARHALQLYSTYVLDRLRESARLGGPGSLHRLAEAIALRTRRPLGEVMRLLVEAKTARETPDGKSTAYDDLVLMRELGQLMKDIGGTREHRRG